MGKASSKPDKTIYQAYREKAGYTREQASEKMEFDGTGYFPSSDRIYKIESGKTSITPDDVMAMAKCYKAPDLCNHYCSNECPIGMQYVPKVEFKELSQIVLETLHSMNNLEKQKNRLIEISVDGRLTEDEFEDFAAIQKNLKQISMAIDALQLWVEKAIADGQINKEQLDSLL